MGDVLSNKNEYSFSNSRTKVERKEMEGMNQFGI
jgi:hypothetical protein